MLNLFGNALPGNGSIRVPTEFHYLQRSLVKELDIVQRHYRLNPKPFPNQHPLIKLITMLPMAWEADDYQYANIIADAHTNISRRLGFTDYQNTGNVFTNGFFLGESTREAVLCVSEPFLYLDLDKTWYKLQPMKYVYHTRSDVSIPLLNNKLKGTGFGLLTLDVSLLMVKYRHWVKYQKTKGDSIPSAAVFVTSFVIPDVLPSYMDIAVFNRMDQNLADLPLRQYPSSHAFYLTNYTKKIDDYNTALINHYKGLRTNAGNILTTIPTFFSVRLLDLLQRPDTIINRNNEWFFTMQRLPFYRFIFRMIEKGYVSDSTFVNKFHASIKLLLNSGYLRAVSDDKFRNYFLSIYNDISK